MVCLSFGGDKVNGELPRKEAQSVKNQTFLKRAFLNYLMNYASFISSVTGKGDHSFYYTHEKHQ